MKKILFTLFIVLSSVFIISCSPNMSDDNSDLLNSDYSDDLVDFGDLTNNDSYQNFQESNLEADLGLQDFNEDILEFGELV
jgi:hypothetical protein